MNTYNLYNNEVVLEFDRENHTYHVTGKGHDRVRFDSVTGITGMLPKYLVPWAAKTVRDSIESVIRPGVAYDEIQLKSIFDTAQKAPNQKKEDAGDIGTLVHDALESFTRDGVVVTLYNPTAQKCLENGMAWARNNKVTFIDSERKIVSLKHKYAGTMDFSCYFGDNKNEIYCGDWKTASGIYDSNFVQIAGYDLALEEETGINISGYVVVNIPKSGKFSQDKNVGMVKEVERHKEAFLHALGLYRWEQENKKIYKSNNFMKGKNESN